MVALWFLAELRVPPPAVEELAKQCLANYTKDHKSHGESHDSLVEWCWMQFGEEKELCFKTLQDASGKTSGMPHGRWLSNTQHRVGWSCSESIWKPFLKAMASEAKDGKGHGHGGHGCGRQYAFPEAALLCKQISWRLKRARLTMGVFGVFGVGTDAQPLPQCDLVWDVEQAMPAHLFFAK